MLALSISGVPIRLYKCIYGRSGQKPALRAFPGLAEVTQDSRDSSPMVTERARACNYYSTVLSKQIQVEQFSPGIFQD